MQRQDEYVLKFFRGRLISNHIDIDIDEFKTRSLNILISYLTFFLAGEHTATALEEHYIA